MLKKILRMTFAAMLMLSAAFALDCAADSSYHIDLRTMLPDGSPNPTYGQEIATGLCACVDFSTMADFSDTALVLTVMMVDNEPVRGVEIDIYTNVTGLIEYSGQITKGEKLENVTDENGLPKTMTLLANQLTDYVKVMAYSTARAQTSGDGQEGELFSITYSIPGGISSLPDSISFSIGQCNLPGTSMEPSILNVACFYPDTLNPVFIELPLATDDSELGIPDQFELSQNYPNPFNPSTRISFAIPEVSDVRLVIYNVLGQTVTTLAEGQVNAGRYEIIWNGLDAQNQQVASGVYFYELKSTSFVARKKMLFLR